MRYCIVILWTIVSTLSFAQGISVSPSRVFFKGEPGQTITQSITFTNQSAAPFRFVSRIQDWDRDSIGTKVYYSQGQLPGSNAGWLSLSDPTIDVPAGETRQVNLTMRIPENDNASRLSNSMLFFTQVKEQNQANLSGLGINVLLEIGVQVYHVPSGLRAGDLEFLAFEDRGTIRKNNTARRQMAIKVKNTGAINKDAYVRLELTHTETGDEIPIKAIPIAMLPDAEQWISFELPADLKGNFLAVAILDAGSQYDLKIAEKEIDY